MSEPRDMDAPVTRRELYEALEVWAGAIVDRIEKKLERVAAKDDLAGLESRMASKNDLGALESRMASKNDLGALESRMASKNDLAALESRLATELRQHTKSSEDELATRLVAVDEQYKDLPPRVTRLEAKVFPARRSRARGSR
jgi:hypothetical protein